MPYQQDNYRKPTWENKKKRTFLYYKKALQRWQISHKLNSQFAWSWSKGRNCPENSVFTEIKGPQSIKTEVEATKIYKGKNFKSESMLRSILRYSIVLPMYS